MARTSSAIASVALLTLGFSAISASAAQAADPVAIDIVSINDFHGRLEAGAPPTATAPTSPAGAAVLAGMVDSYRAANPNTAFVAAGDLIGASTFTSFIQQDQPTIDAFNAMGLDASSFGNHEFDLGRTDVDERILPAANWDYLGANLYEAGTESPAFQEFSLEQFGEVTVGFIGAVTDELPSLVSPAGIDTLTVGPVVPAVNRVADQLSDGDETNGEADVVVLLVHEGAATPTIEAATDDSRFGQIVTGANANVDAIVSGHTHLAYDFDIPIPGTETTRPVYSSGQYGERYSHLALSVDPVSGDILSIGAEVLDLYGAFDPDPEVAAIVADAVAVATVEGSVKVGDVTADFNRAVQSDGAENRGGESDIGNFVADVQLWSTVDKGAQLAFMNPGGIRANLTYPANPTTPGDADGVVTYQEAAGIQPFANTLVTMDLTGAQIKEALEQQWQPAGASRPVLHLGVSEGFEYTYDPTGAAGDRIRSMYFEGAPIGPDDVFTVVVNSFLAAGGDNFGAFATGSNVADSGKVDLASMVDYFVANPVATPDYGQRAVGVGLSAPDADGYTPGDEVTLSLSSLLMSKDGPREGTVVVSADGVELASASIDPTIVDTTDEVGRATVTVRVPEVAAGPLALTIAVAGTDTSIEVPIEVTAPPVTNVEPPSIAGKAAVGKQLTARPGRWSVDDPEFTYQWNRAGVAIEGATDRRYRVTAADAGTELTVTVTAVVEEGSASATSEAETVAKVRSTISGELSRFIVREGGTLDYEVTVEADRGIVPTGELEVYDGRTLVATAQLTDSDGGRITITLPASGSGIHLVTARYSGDDQVKPATGRPNLYYAF
jgi:5'-nucleotidase